MPRRPDDTAITFRWERRRALASGVIETASTTFLVLIAVRWFRAGALAKGLVASGTGVGYLIAPIIVAGVEAAGLPVAAAASRIALAGALVLLVAALRPTEPLFVLAGVLSIAAFAAMTPLLTQVYQENYPDAERGRLFARTMVVRIAAATVFSLAAGFALAWRIGLFRVALAGFGAAFLLAAWCLRHVPSRPLRGTGASHPLRALSHLRDDRVFRVTLIAWMFMGFANLGMLPLRVEYLANPRYHLALSTSTIAILTGALPNVARLAATPFWGRVFDRANFFVLRIVLNGGMAIGITSFFVTRSIAGLSLSAIVFGASVAGGDVAWALWVTKLAPPARVADYMGVHAFLTGARALVAPIVGFALLDVVAIGTLAWSACALIAVATLVLLPIVPHGRTLRREPALVPPLPADDGEP
jgi:hypothetical protein